MLRWAVLFMLVALIAALLGFTDMAGNSFLAAKVAFFVFVVLFVITLLIGHRRPAEVT